MYLDTTKQPALSVFFNLPQTYTSVPKSRARWGKNYVFLMKLGGNKLGLNWAKLSLSWGLGRMLKPERLHMWLRLIV